MAKEDKKAVTFKLIGKEAIAKEIGLIRAAGARFDMRIHACAMACLNHIKLHGDNTLLLDLYHALPNSFRKNSFLKWAEEFGGIEVITKGKDGKSLKPADYKFKKVRKVTEEDMAKASEAQPMTFARGSEGGDYRGYDMYAEIAKVIARTKKALDHVKEKPEDGSKVKGNREDLVVLENLLKDHAHDVKHGKNTSGEPSSGEVIDVEYTVVTKEENKARKATRNRARQLPKAA